MPVIQDMKSLCKRFIADRAANMVTLFAMSSVPVTIMIGGAMDMSMAQSSQSHVQNAIDAAVLAGAKAMQESASDAEIKTIANNYFSEISKANGLTAECQLVDTTPDWVNFELTATVDCYQETLISGMVGVEKIDFRRKAKTAYGVGKLDVAFMFDTSGSMGWDNRMVDLKKAAKEAVDIILASKVQEEGDVRIAISTYATSVNVGTDYFKKVTNMEPTRQVCTRWRRGTCRRYSTITSTCVTGREGSQKYTSAKPSGIAWIPQGTTSCNSATITPLTDDANELKAAINALPTTGMTAGHLGIAWAWYLIAPEWKSIWPADSEPKPHDDPDLTKVVILMTDGSFNQDYMGGGDSNDHAKKFCDAIAAQDIVIYSVAFKAPSSGKQILEYCGKDSGGFFDANSGQQLTDAYKTIATQISDLRIAE